VRVTGATSLIGKKGDGEIRLTVPNLCPRHHAPRARAIRPTGTHARHHDRSAPSIAIGELAARGPGRRPLLATHRAARRESGARGGRRARVKGGTAPAEGGTRRCARAAAAAVRRSRRDQRDGRRAAHQPRPRPLAPAGSPRSPASPRATPARVRPRPRHARVRHRSAATCWSELTGAADALVVNNAAGRRPAGAQRLARGGEAIVSRGELGEIGGSFRIPDIMARARREKSLKSGQTNRTHPNDYDRAADG